MPEIEVDVLFQDAVLWAASGTVDAYGQMTVLAPVDIAVRWVARRTEISDGKGGTITLDVQAAVPYTVDVGSVMWLGTLADWNDFVLSPTTDYELHVVNTSNTSEDIRGVSIRRELGLTKQAAGYIPPLA